MTVAPHRKIKRALISVYDKTGIVEFARALVDEFGIEIISTGGTAALLKEHGIPVTLVEEITGFPEMLDGRVKTLHPKIHAGILADRDNPEHMRQLEQHGIKPIDMVVANLYPFEQTVSDPNCTFEQAIEMIDIGGPCMLRATAKNHRHVIPVIRTQSHGFVLEALKEDGDLAESARACLASIVFEITSSYDETVEAYLSKRWINLREESYDALQSQTAGLLKGTQPHTSTAAPDFLLSGPASNLRYGENPHQSASLLQHIEHEEPCDLTTADWPTDDDQQRGMSFNNYADAHAALGLCAETSRDLCNGNGKRYSCTFIKHTNACGVGFAGDPIDAYRRAYLGDPNAAMGGILACNFDVVQSFADRVMETYARWGKEAGAGGFFVEVWVAPTFEDDAVEHIRSVKPWGQRVRLLAVGDMNQPPNPDELEYKSISGGMLVQTRDTVGLNEDQWKVVTKRQPTESEMSDLRLAWLVAKHTKSNAISICKEGMLIGNGAGQMSRVMSCRIATWLANENGHSDKLPGSAAASDAFFPFPDGPNILIDAGVSAIIQPGGSKRDEEVIAACDARNVAMIFTGTRHFKH